MPCDAREIPTSRRFAPAVIHRTGGCLTSCLPAVNIAAQLPTDQNHGPADDRHPSRPADRLCLHRRFREDARRLARRLPHAGWRQPGALRRQGAQPQGAGDELFAPRPAFGPHRPDDPRDAEHDGPHHPDRDRGAAARAESHQAAEAALQRAAARRQVIPEHPRDHGARLAADQEASRRQDREGRLLRPLRRCRCGEPDAEPVAARVPAAQLL